jgi:hypothetical protein
MRGKQRIDERERNLHYIVINYSKNSYHRHSRDFVFRPVLRTNLMIYFFINIYRPEVLATSMQYHAGDSRRSLSKV